MSSQPTTIQDAPEPFSGAHSPEHPHPPSDIILRSSDSVDFHVHKDILKFGSVFFGDMVALGKVTLEQTMRDGKPVVVLSEPTDVVHKLLRLAYPARSLVEHAQDLDYLYEVHEAAQKYQFHTVPSLIESILDDSLAREGGQPYRVFMIARLCGFTEMARRAAIASLSSAHIFGLGDKSPEMDKLTWRHAHRYFEFRRECGKAASSFIAGLVARGGTLGSDEVNFPWWVEDGHSERCVGHSEGGCREYRNTRGWETRETNVLWFKNCLARLSAEVLDVPGQFPLKLTQSDWEIIFSCPRCIKTAKKDLKEWERNRGDAAGTMRWEYVSLAKRFFE